MRCNMDAFIQAVEEARARLVRQEGAGISMREILRRAGYTDNDRAGAAYHLNRNKKWEGGHRVPPELVERLARVLPISHEELSRAAQAALGYEVNVTRPDLYAVARFLEDDGTSAEDKAEVVAELARMVADEMTKRSLRT